MLVETRSGKPDLALALAQGLLCLLSKTGAGETRLTLHIIRLAKTSKDLLHHISFEVRIKVT